MKRYLFPIVSAVAAVGLALVAFGQAPDSTGARTGRAMYRERQQKAISAIEEQLAKMKSAMESAAGSRESRQNLSDEERTKLRAKLRQEREQSIALIEDELAKLKGRRSLMEKHEETMTELKTIHDLAVKEKAAETAAAIEKLVTAKNKVFEERLQKLGLPERPARTKRPGT